MQRLELEPTDENIYLTLKENKIGRNDQVFQMVNLLNSFNKAYSIAVDSPWGSGKTFFVKQVAMVLDAMNDYNKDSSEEKAHEIIKIFNTATEQQINLQEGNSFKDQLCVYYNAWKHDQDYDPISSIIFSIIQELNLNNLVEDKNIREGLEELAREILDKTTGISLSKVIDKTKGKSLFKELCEETNLENKIHDFLDKLLYVKRKGKKKKLGDRLVIFIDDLDRCQPTYAVKLLEKIKHYFNHKDITFVFSVNREQLVHTIEREYGDDFEAERYLDRFFDITATLMPIYPDSLFKLTKVDTLPYLLNLFTIETIEYYSLQLRDILKFSEFVYITALELRINDFGTSEEMNYPFGRTQSFCTHLIPIMAALRLTDMEQYRLFLEGKDSKPFTEIFKRVNAKNDNYLLRNIFQNAEILDEDKAEEVAELIYTAIFNNDNPYETIIGNLEFTKQSKRDLLKRFSLLRKECNYYPENQDRRN